MGASFVQSSFLGGEWSPLAQGRVTDPAYKTACNIMFNAYPTEAGAWTRRSGARYLAHTKGGLPAKLRAFDFNVKQPYMCEFSSGFLRFFAGLGLLSTEASDGTVYLGGVQTANPAKIIVLSTIPAGWANGDTVTFSLNSVPASCPDLLGRQFLIANLDTGTQSFTLQDAITGDDVDGSAWTYTPPAAGSPADQIFKVLELATPYTGTLWNSIRTVQNSTDLLVLQASVQPQVVTKGDIGEGDTQFVINPQAFTDGPYLDINTYSTTCALGGLSGSVSITFNSTTNVNHGEGLQSTDVGRLLRFQGGPAAWVTGNTYPKQATVLGSDENIYTSIVGANTGHDPTTDDGTHWQIAPQTIIWTWLQITAVTDDTHATGTIMGETLQSATATTQWQLGLYSDTTGWPSCGVYHDGRLWIAGTNFDDTNRVDGSVSDDFFNFAPTAFDGTVADDNGVSATFNADDVNAIFWLLSTEDGLILGTQAGEWRIQASVLNDPITPTNIQARRVSKYGCANIEPVQAGAQTVFVQRQQRRLVAHEQDTAGSYVGVNLTANADHTSVSGIDEIAWQQEPLLCIWQREDDGSLTGATYRKRHYSGFTVEVDAFNGFHRHQLANGRTVKSIQASPAYDGLSDTLYFITNQPHPSQPDHNVYWVQTFMPFFDTGQPDWAAYFTDGGGTPPYAQLFQTSNGDSFDGIRIFGLWPLNGLTVAPVLGGLDLGDRTVSNGRCDVAFGTDPDAQFTLAFFQGLNDGTDYDVFSVGAGSITSGTNTPPVAANSLLAYVGDDSVVMGNSGYQVMLADGAGEFVYQMNAGGSVPGVRKFDAVSGVEIAQTALTMPATVYYLHDNGFIYVSTGGNTSPIQEISTATATFGASNAYGASSSSLSGSGITPPPTHFQLMDGTICGCTIPGVDGINRDYIVFTGLRGAQTINEVTFVQVNGQGTWVDSGGNSLQLNTAQVDGKTYVSACTGPVLQGGAIFFAMERPYPGTWATDGTEFAVLHQFVFDQTHTSIGSFPLLHLTAPQIDPTWTNITNIVGPAYDQIDGTVLFFIETGDAVTNTKYLCKFNPWTVSFLWKLAWPGNDNIGNFSDDQTMASLRLRGRAVFVQVGSGNGAYLVDTVAGTVTTQAINSGFSFSVPQFYDEGSGSVTFYGGFSPGSGPTMHYLGAYLPANGDTMGGQWGRFYLGVDYPSGEQTTTYTVPLSLGTTYTSQGQLLRPDFGPDAGTRNGPAFGKKRRLHWYSASAYRVRSVTFGTNFTQQFAAPLADQGSALATAPALYSGVFSTTITSDYSFSEQIAWQITRPYPATFTAMGGYVEAMDK